MRNLLYITLTVCTALLVSSCSSSIKNIGTGNSYPVFSSEKMSQPTSFFDHALRLQNGDGVSQNYILAEKMYANSSRAGDARAENNLGVMAIRGQGGKVDYKKAIVHFEKAAQMGSAAAHYNVGLMYESGSGVSKNYYMAKREYNKASNMGFAPAQYRMARMFEEGLGGEVSAEKADRFYQMAALGGNQSSIEKLKSLSKSRKISKADVRYVVAVENCDSCENTSMKKMAGRELNSLYKLAGMGDASAQYNLAARLLDGSNAVRDVSEAVRMFTLAARQGYSPAQRQIAEMHLSGTGVVKSKTIGLAWLILASRGDGQEALIAKSRKHVVERSMASAQIAQAQALANTCSMKGR